MTESQDEQQTPPSPDGLGCSGESSVQPAAITVAGITFNASQVKSAVVVLDGRDVHIGEKDEGKSRVGFNNTGEARS